MNSLIVTFLPVILLCLCNGTLVVLSGKKFGKCIPVSMISVVLILYISQFIFHTFNVGYVLIIIWACAFAILLVMNKRNLPGGVLSLIIFLLDFIHIFVRHVFSLFWIFTDHLRCGMSSLIGE